MMLKQSLLFISLFALTLMGNAQSPTNSKATTGEWQFVNSFACSTGRQHAIAFDGEFIYTAAWGKSEVVLSMFYKYDLDGNLIEEFDVPGMTNDVDYLRDMTYDGEYFYGCDAHSGKIWCVDLHNKVLVNDHAINTAYTELGTCTYDPVNDAFWVGERAKGSSPNLMTDLNLVNRNGVVLQTATAQNIGGHTVHGTGYFTDENGAAHLYLFAVEGFTAHVFDYNIANDSMDPNFIFDFSVTPGWSFACSAGGAYIGDYNGVTYFFGDVDKGPNLIGIYALSEYTPGPITPPEGDIFFDFNDGIMHWTTIDADGDNYCWEIRPNYGNTQNPCSVTSASNFASTPLTPENYLVTPYKLDCEQISFIACAQDADHPAEHLGVAVSTTGNTEASDFTIVWETDMTVKGPGNWHFYQVDLRAYQGQDIYVAIVHFNCTDQFWLNVDDITLHRSFDAVAEQNTGRIMLYPNPASDRIVVESAETINSCEVYNMTGALVLRREVGLKSFDLNVSELVSGVYLIKLSGDTATQTQRLVKR